MTQAVPADFTMKAHDLLPVIEATLTSGGFAIDLTLATSVHFIMKNSATNTVAVNALASILSPTQGTVRYTWVTGDTNVVGSYLGEWSILWSGGRQQTVPTLTYHTISILADLDNA
jgi:hypothetical protein